MNTTRWMNNPPLEQYDKVLIPVTGKDTNDYVMNNDAIAEVVLAGNTTKGKIATENSNITGTADKAAHIVEPAGNKTQWQVQSVDSQNEGDDKSPEWLACFNKAEGKIKATKNLPNGSQLNGYNVVTSNDVYLKGETLTETEIKELLSTVYKYKGSVANYDSLPKENNEIGDVYNTEDTGLNYAWDGTRWDELGMKINLDLYARKTELSDGSVTKVANNAVMAKPTGDEVLVTADADGTVQAKKFTENGKDVAVIDDFLTNAFALNNIPLKANDDIDNLPLGTYATVDFSIFSQIKGNKPFNSPFKIFVFKGGKETDTSSQQLAIDWSSEQIAIRHTDGTSWTAWTQLAMLDSNGYVEKSKLAKNLESGAKVDGALVPNINQTVNIQTKRDLTADDDLNDFYTDDKMGAWGVWSNIPKNWPAEKRYGRVDCLRYTTGNKETLQIVRIFGENKIYIRAINEEQVIIDWQQLATNEKLFGGKDGGQWDDYDGDLNDAPEGFVRVSKSLPNRPFNQSYYILRTHNYNSSGNKVQIAITDGKIYIRNIVNNSSQWTQWTRLPHINARITASTLFGKAEVTVDEFFMTLYNKGYSSGDTIPLYWSYSESVTINNKGQKVTISGGFICIGELEVNPTGPWTTSFAEITNYEGTKYIIELQQRDEGEQYRTRAIIKLATTDGQVEMARKYLLSSSNDLPQKNNIDKFYGDEYYGRQFAGSSNFIGTFPWEGKSGFNLRIIQGTGYYTWQEITSDGGNTLNRAGKWVRAIYNADGTVYPWNKLEIVKTQTLQTYNQGITKEV